MLIRGMLLATTFITLVAQFVDIIYRYIASWSQPSEDHLPDLDIDKLCRNSPFEEELNTVYDLRIESGHIFINGVDMGPELCIKAFKFREVIVMSTQTGDFLLLRGKIYSVTKGGPTREWFGKKLLGDSQSQKKDYWLFSAALDDKDQNLN